jgi:hypothetical protein
MLYVCSKQALIRLRTSWGCSGWFSAVAAAVVRLSLRPAFCSELETQRRDSKIWTVWGHTRTGLAASLPTETCALNPGSGPAPKSNTLPQLCDSCKPARKQPHDLTPRQFSAVDLCLICACALLLLGCSNSRIACARIECESVDNTHCGTCESGSVQHGSRQNPAPCTMPLSWTQWTRCARLPAAVCAPTGVITRPNICVDAMMQATNPTTSRPHHTSTAHTGSVPNAAPADSLQAAC